MIAGGIALQNIPEGMVIIGPMLAAGISPRKTLICAMATGLVEVLGTLLGYFAVTIATAILPFALAFAGGTMLYVISDEMIPETHHDNESGATYALLVGFCPALVESLSPEALGWTYSAVYNGFYMVPEMIFTAIAAGVIAKVPGIVKKLG